MYSIKKNYKENNKKEKINLKVSVIIPIYNVEKYLKECLDSVINQTLKEIEIICIDDGSTDNSGKILDEYALKDDRIKVIHKENGGYGKAMNIGIDNATGKYLGIVEPDDYIKSNMYEILYNKAIETEVDFIKSDFYRFVHKNGKKMLFYNKLDESGTYYDRIINPQEDFEPFKFIMNIWCGIYKKEFITKYNIRFNETPGASFQDNGFWFQTLCRAKKLYILKEPFYMNRRDNPFSSVNSKEKVFCIKQEYDHIKNFLDNNWELKEKFLKVYNYAKFLNYMSTFRRIHIKFKNNFLKVFQKEFKLAYNNNEIDKNLFSKKDLIKLYILLKSTNLYYYLYSLKQKFKLNWLRKRNI